VRLIIQGLFRCRRRCADRPLLSDFDLNHRDFSLDTHLLLQQPRLPLLRCACTRFAADLQLGSQPIHACLKHPFLLLHLGLHLLEQLRLPKPRHRLPFVGRCVFASRSSACCYYHHRDRHCDHAEKQQRRRRRSGERHSFHILSNANDASRSAPSKGPLNSPGCASGLQLLLMPGLPGLANAKDHKSIS